jgi:hypothetical protein
MQALFRNSNGRRVIYRYNEMRRQIAWLFLAFAMTALVPSALMLVGFWIG